MPSFKHSTVLFTDDDGHPMKFFMRPCAEKQRLHPLIEHGGGLLSSKWVDGMHRLVDPGCKILNKSNNCLSSKFILDCVERNCLQDIEEYKVKIETVDISDISEDEASKYTIRTTKRSMRTRHEYTDNDDYTILDYVIKSKRYNETKGKRIWINLQDRKVLPNRTWQSLREHYVKKIIPHIYKYDVSEKHRKLLLNPFIPDGEKSNTSDGSDDSFTSSDDLLILDILFKCNRLCRVSEDALWKEIEDTNKASRSWKSLKDRFFKKIIPTLNIYNLSLQQIDELNNAVKIPFLVLASARCTAKKLVSNKMSKESRAASISENECNADENINLKRKQNSAIKQLIVLDKHKACKNGTDENVTNITKDLSESKTKKEKQAFETVSDSYQSPHKNNINEALCPQVLKSPSSNDDDSDVTNFENKCLSQYQFQRKIPKVPIKKLSMKAIQQHVAEIEKSPPRKLSSSSAADFQEWNLRNFENHQSQPADVASVELSPKEMLDSQTPVTIENIVDALDGEWPETSDELTLRLSHEESDDDSSTTIANINDLKQAGGTIDTSTTEKSPLHQDNNKSPIQNVVDAKNSLASKECSVTMINCFPTKNLSDDYETSSESKQDTTDTFSGQPLKHRKLRRGKKLIKKNIEPHHASSINNNHHIMPCAVNTRKRNADSMNATNSEAASKEDLSISNSLTVALKHIKSIKEICENWCDASDVSDISVPVNSVNCIQKELDELQILLYKAQLLFSSSEIMKKSHSDIDEDDVLLLLKFLIVHGNYNFEDINNIISNKTSPC